MDLELIIALAVAAVAIVLYVVAQILDRKGTISALTGASNVALALAVVAIGLAYGLGLKVSVSMLINPDNWVDAVNKLIKQI